MRFGILVFPGTWSDTDCHHAVHGVLGQDADYVWHKEDSVAGYDAIIVPGGFSYGDYLRAGAIARFSPVMSAVRDFAAAGGVGHRHLQRVPDTLRGRTAAGRAASQRAPGIPLPVDAPADGTGGHAVQQPLPRGSSPGGSGVPTARATTTPAAATIAQLEEQGRVLFRYCEPDGAVTEAANPNGSVSNIAGIINEGRNVLGMMPHPERSCELLLGSDDGNLIFGSMIDAGAGQPGPGQ